MKLAITLLAAIGIALSSAALYEHYNMNTSPCDINARWDCGTVNHSSYSAVKGIPTAAIGMAGYALIAIVAWTGPAPLLLLVAATALGISLELTAIEASVLRVYCLYCVASQATIGVIAVLSFVQAMGKRRFPAQP
ncbi:MAG TPA: vitamin K epoxide reductase family protein [Terriglobales bacterium]|nr:vitamin K epoxide reductase family protein [Terriglobales bacterium]